MAHFAKYKWHEYVGLVKNDRTLHDRDVQHPERQKENFIYFGFEKRDGDKYFWTNKHVAWNDTEKILGEVKMNHDFALKNAKVMRRKNVNHVVSMVFTCPPDVRPEDQRKCLVAAANFMSIYREFGGKPNFLLASFHFDEETPHMDYDFCPVTEDGRLSAKDVLTKKVLQRFHSDLGKYIDKALGYHVSVENGKTQTGNKSINKLKADSYKEEIKKLKSEIKQLKSEVKFFRNGLDRAEGFMNAAERLGVSGKIQRAVVDSDYPGEAVLNGRYDIYHQQRVDAGKKRVVAKAPAERGMV